MNVVDIVGLIALLKKTVDTLRYATAKQINGIVTQVLAWGAGVGGVFIVAQTQWAAHISVGNGQTLAQQGAFSLVAIGLSIASSGSVLTDLTAALDNTNTSLIPPLLQKYAGQARAVVAQATQDAGSPIITPSLVEHLRAEIAAEVQRVLGSHQSQPSTPAPPAAPVPPVAAPPG